MSEELSLEINLVNVRVSYPHIFEPYAGPNGGRAKYSAKFLLSKTEHKALIATAGAQIKALIAKEFKGKTRVPAGDKLCLRDGDQSGVPDEAGFWTLSASESTRPVVVHKDRSPLVESDGVIYPGCRVNAKIRLWAQDNTYGVRINANLLGVQFVKDDEKLGSGRTQYSADDLFEDVSGAFGDDSPTDADPFG